MSTYEALSLMIAFGILVATIISGSLSFKLKIYKERADGQTSDYLSFCIIQQTNGICKRLLAFCQTYITKIYTQPNNSSPVITRMAIIIMRPVFLFIFAA